jgi:CheY-like chemotaxis protein
METIPFPNVNKKICILVVDDHPSTATTLARALSQMGPKIEALSATSGENALELIGDKPVDILITDMMMVGMNGLELIEKLQSHPAGRPAYTMLITAYDVPGLKITAQRLKVNEIIIKPIRPERICQIVGKAIENIEGDCAVQVPEGREQLKILVADDQPDNVSLLSRYLSTEGYACISASNGLEALNKIRAEMPDLVLLDVNMPQMDGFETLNEIRSDPAIGHIPVIMLTAARLDAMDMQTALNMGADDYVTKPFDRRELFARIRTRLRVKEAEDVIRRRNKELNMLPEIGRELSARLDVHDLIEVVVRRTVETMGALVGQIILLSKDGKTQETAFFSGSATRGDVGQIPALESLIAKVNEKHEGIIVKDIHKDESWHPASDDPTHSALIVPMYGRFELLGLLILSHEQSGYFLLEHRLLLQAIASQAAIAIENARLHETVMQEQQMIMAVLQSNPQAILVFDGAGCVKITNPAAEKLFSDLKLNQPLKPGIGYDTLIRLVGITSKMEATQKQPIDWPDGRRFTLSLIPIKNGGCTVFFQEKSLTAI